LYLFQFVDEVLAVGIHIVWGKISLQSALGVFVEAIDSDMDDYILVTNALSWIYFPDVVGFNPTSWHGFVESTTVLVVFVVEETCVAVAQDYSAVLVVLADGP
jgi:hypothetical protein